MMMGLSRAFGWLPSKHGNLASLGSTAWLAVSGTPGEYSGIAAKIAAGPKQAGSGSQSPLWQSL
jgi:hypothetical protein